MFGGTGPLRAVLHPGVAAVVLPARLRRPRKDDAVDRLAPGLGETLHHLGGATQSALLPTRLQQPLSTRAEAWLRSGHVLALGHWFRR